MRPTLGLAAILLLVGCASGQGNEDNPFSDEFTTRGGQIELVVSNVNFQDATLTAFHQAGRQRLGVVDGKGSRRFTMDWEGTRDLQIQIDLLSSVSYLTPPLSVSIGDVLRLQIETVLSQSQLIR